MTGMLTYLDYNATAPLRDKVIAAMDAAMRLPGNASSVHAPGRMARKIVEEAREKIAAHIGTLPQQIIFTSGGTEANNTALKMSGRKRILVSAVEHDSVRLVEPKAEIIPVDANGIIDIAALEKMLQASNEPALVAVMLANNETGVIQPIGQIAEIAHRCGALLHVDAVQALGKMQINFVELGADMMSLSAHKAGGPQGAGALVFTDKVPLGAMLRGGGQERSRRAGTENVAAIAGFGALIDALDVNEIGRMAYLRNQLESRLVNMLPGTVIFGQAAPRLPNTSTIAHPGMTSAMQVMRCDMEGIAISAGSACSSGKVKPSHILQAMGVASELVDSSIRISIGWKTNEADIERFVGVWADLFHTQQKAKAA
jgi:cysteine desulfurase